MEERYEVNYINGTRRESFSIFAHGRREAAAFAKDAIKEFYPDLVYEISRCSRTAIEILGKDTDGNVEIKSSVALYVEPED